MLNLRDILELIDDCFHDRALSQQQAICQRQQFVLHVGAQLGDQLDVESLYQEFKERLGKIAFVAKQLTEQLLDQFGNRLAVIDISWRESNIEQLAPIIDDQMQFESEEPARRTLASLG